MSDSTRYTEPGWIDPEMLEHHARWWRREEMLHGAVPEGPLADLWLPLADGTLAQHDMDLRPEMLDLDALTGPSSGPGPLEHRGDRIATREPYGRVPWVEAILGCPIHATIQGGSMRTLHFVTDWDAWLSAPPTIDREWRDCLYELTGRLAAQSGGRYAVTQTLMRGPSDLAEAALGSERMSLALYDRPDALRRFTEWATEVFLDVWQGQTSRIPPVAGGYVNWYGLWAPGKVVRTQCDASAFLSPKQYRDWFLPYDAEISRAADYSLIHLHSGSLHTVDVLLEVEHPQAIQVSLDPAPSGPPAPSLIPIFRRILEVKPLVIDGFMSEEEVHRLQQELPHGGLCLIDRVAPEGELPAREARP